MTQVTKDFTRVELACKHCGLFQFHPSFLTRLQDARTELNASMTITSGCRCAIHNANVGGKTGSFHIGDDLPHRAEGQLGALAVDIAADDGNYRGRLFSILWKHGFSIGWNAKKKFLHADQRILIGWQQTTFDY